MKKVSHIEYREFLNRHFIRLGGGLYSTVYSKPCWDKVIKIGNGDAWPDYVLWANREGWEATFAPKLYAFKQHNGFYVAILERLVDTISGFPETNCDIIKAYSYTYKIKNGIGSNGYENPLLKQFITEMRDIVPFDDCHTSNCMFRADGQFVITDPTCGTSSKSIKRYKHGSQIAA